MTTPSPEALQTREQMLNDLRMERAAGNIPAPTPTDSGEDEASKIIRKAADLIKPADKEVVFYLRVGGEYSHLSTHAGKNANPQECLTKAIAALSAERDDATNCPAHRLAFSRPEPVGAGIAAALQAIADLPTARSEEMMEGEERAYRAVQALATPSHLPPAEPNEGPSKEWCLRMAELEGDAKIGAGMPDHPLRDISPQGCQAESALIVAHGLLRSYSGTASDAGDAFKVLDAALRALPASGETARIEPVGDEALVERVALQREAQKLRDHFRAYPVGYVTRHDLSGLFSALDRAAIQAIPAPATDAGQSAGSLVEALRSAQSVLNHIGLTEGLDPQGKATLGKIDAALASLPKSPSAGEEA